ncbi:MAG: hypothetical protein AVDCRST_MAG19-1428, partial [uncultured Thermomicrobiales bacterium]
EWGWRTGRASEVWRGQVGATAATRSAAVPGGGEAFRRPRRGGDLPRKLV